MALDGPLEYAEGELYNDTISQMNIIDKRNYLLKARRSSVCLMSALSPEAIANMRDEGRSSMTPDKKSSSPSLPALLYNQPKAEIEQLVQNFHNNTKYSTCPGPELDGKGEDVKKLDLPVPLARGQSRSRMRNSSMFSVANNHMQLQNLHHRGSMELGGIVKDVVGDLSKKMKKSKAQRASETDPLASHLKKLKPINGSSKIRSLSADLRIEHPPLRHTKSAHGAMVVYSMKPEVDVVHCPNRRKANVNMKSKIFQRAVFAIRVQNKICKSVWK